MIPPVGSPAFPATPRSPTREGTDRRHRLVSSAILMLPLDVRLSAIIDYRSPLPVLVTSGTRLNDDDYSGDLPPGFNASNTYGCRDLDLGLANAYRQSIGQDAVNSFACSNFLNVDFRASRNFYLSGTHGIELVFRCLNAFDRANFGSTNGNLRSGAFGDNEGGLAANINAPSRQIELALRYSF